MQSGKRMGGGGSWRVENRVSIELAYKTKEERHELRRKLESELSSVRNLVKKLERNSSNLRSLGDDGYNDTRKLKRVHSEVASVGWNETRPIDQLSVNPEHSQCASDNIEKDKRTSKENQFYRSTEFILGKEQIPPSNLNKKSKGTGKNGELGSGFGIGNCSSKVLKSCSVLLDKLMKHKHGWVFNTPVDVKALGLHDYFTIIKHPMDLGTVKTRLNTNWYKSPKEFAEDVRLTFQNAMTYNPKGHDVHIMAEILLNIFEEKWATIEAENLQELGVSSDYEASLLTPTSRKAPLPPPLPPPPQPAPPLPPLDISESMNEPVCVKPKNTKSNAPGRTPVPKKPKAKDPNKRDMTYTEKQKLSTHLQNLPSEKLDSVVHIIRKRNPSLCQNDDEIELDIDSVDTETLWELDRFVMNYRKNLSKIKRTAELGQVRGDAEANVPEKNEALSTLKEPKQSKAEVKNALSPPPVQGEKKSGYASSSNGSRSSSSDSGSSSRESDRENSSA